MEERFDRELVLERARAIAAQIRRSEAYPAIVGGIAGGIAGALIAAMIASRIAARAEPPAATASGHRSQDPRGGLDLRRAVELLTIVAGLVKQAREWYSQERKR